ncbi:hypothetical protein N9N67_01045 [Bacteriovoracaceae bacterium]|nr:hypothetical protein [Bacteriovoracaceae bacterium]
MKVFLYLIMISSAHLAFSSEQCLNNVEQVVKNLTNYQKSVKIKANTKNVFANKQSFRMSPLNKFGFHNHLQGATLIPGTNNKYFLVSGGDQKLNQSWLYLGKYTDTNGFKKAVLLKSFPLISRFNRWHVGGIGIHNQTIALPMETIGMHKSASVYFYKLELNQETDHAELIKLPREIHLSDFGGGAVDIEKKRNYGRGLYDLVVFDNRKINYFPKINITHNRPFSRPIRKVTRKWLRKNPSPPRNESTLYANTIFASKVFKASNVDIIKDCQENYYFLSVHNKSFLPPVNTKKNGVTLYTFNPKSRGLQFANKEILSKKLRCRKHCNFRAAAGSIVENGKLKIFSTPYFRKKRGRLLRGKLFSN